MHMYAAVLVTGVASLFLTDEKDGLAVSFKESSRLIDEAKKTEVQLQSKLKALEQQVQLLKDKDQEVNPSMTRAKICFPRTVIYFLISHKQPLTCGHFVI